jgi:hypothetical protein
MAITADDLRAFHRFAQERVINDGADSLQELVDLWEIEHPKPDAHAQNVAAVRAALRDMENGDKGRPAEQLIEELRVELASRAT